MGFCKCSHNPSIIPNSDLGGTRSTPKCGRVGLPLAFLDAPLSYGKKKANPHRKARYLSEWLPLKISRFSMKKHDFPHFLVGPVFVKQKK